MSLSPPLLPEDTIRRLKNRDASLITDPQNGQRAISIQLLSPPHSASSSSSRTASSSTTESDTLLIPVPTHLDSAPSFEFLGFTPERAKEMYDTRKAYNEKHDPVWISIIEWARCHLDDACLDVAEDDWISIMTQAGIKTDIQGRLMREEYAALRSTQGLYTWLYEIIETNYLVLEDLNAQILFSLDSTPCSLRGGQGEDYTVPQTPGGHIALFKSVEFRRSAGCTAEDGSINLNQLVSKGPTDFSKIGGLYFTHQLWVAKRYSSYIGDMCPLADRRTVEIHVPLHHFQTVKMWDLKFEDDDYKQLLYYSRRVEKYPKHITRKRAEYGVIKGPIAGVHNKVFNKIQNWEEIKGKHQLVEEYEEEDEDEIKKGDHEKKKKFGVQYVWLREDIIAKLEDDVHGKTYLRRPERGFRLIAQPWNDQSVAHTSC